MFSGEVLRIGCVTKPPKKCPGPFACNPKCTQHPQPPPKHARRVPRGRSVGYGTVVEAPSQDHDTQYPQAEQAGPSTYGYQQTMASQHMPAPSTQATESSEFKGYVDYTQNSKSSDFVFVQRHRKRLSPSAPGQRNSTMTRGWSEVEDNFLIYLNLILDIQAAKQAYGMKESQGEAWAEYSDKMDEYLRANFPKIALSSSRKVVSTIRDHWRHVRKGQVPDQCLVKTYKNSVMWEHPEWMKERSWIMENHFPDADGTQQMFKKS
ncbi:hypothetical protein ABW21_db0203533 [Orbilia brochopaga]|nr:hypothetical protein ABW21_db0203533 [Drechslerella brochopaga]